LNRADVNRGISFDSGGGSREEQHGDGGPLLRAERFLVLLARDLQSIRFFFLTIGFFFRAVLFLEFRGFRDGELRFGIGSLGVQDESETFGESGMD
jgi:hypothetical protein